MAARCFAGSIQEQREEGRQGEGGAEAVLSTAWREPGRARCQGHPGAARDRATSLVARGEAQWVGGKLPLPAIILFPVFPFFPPLFLRW